jgi:hypothetical protein
MLLLIQYITAPLSGLGQTLAGNRAKIGTEGNNVKGDLLKNRFRSPRRSKRSGDLSDETQRLERFAPIVRWVTARVVFHNLITPVDIFSSNLIIPMPCGVNRKVSTRRFSGAAHTIPQCARI